MRTRILADGPTPKKCKKIRQNHKTPSEKEKKRNAKSVPTCTFFTYTLKEITAYQKLNIYFLVKTG